MPQNKEASAFYYAASSPERFPGGFWFGPMVPTSTGENPASISQEIPTKRL